MYIIETEKGYIKEFTMIVNVECIYINEAYKFKKKELKRFFIFRKKKKYKIYKVNDY